MKASDPTVHPEPNELGTTAILSSVAPVLVPTERYRSESWAELERTRLWPHVWQLACTTSHVPNPGDFYEFRCGRLSSIIVRGEDDVIRGFQNACRHRGNSICQGGGSGLDELRCPFHRWAWKLDGTLKEVPSRKAFGSGFATEDFGLLAISVETWGPLVFVNLDPRAQPLEDFLAEIPADIAWARPEDFRCRTAVTIAVSANWKVVAEGFSETYHVQGIHPELLPSFDDVHSPQVIWGHHGVSYQRYGVPNPRQGQDHSDQAIWDSFVITQGERMGVSEACPAPTVPEGETITDVIASRIRAQEARRGVDLSGFTTEQVTGLSQYNLFPNTTILISADLFTVLVARPGATVGEADFTIFNLERSPDPEDAERIEHWVLPADADVPMGTVMGQDLALLRTAQLGLDQPGLSHLAVGSEEPRIINLHRNLEKWLRIEPSELLPIGSGA